MNLKLCPPYARASAAAKSEEIVKDSKAIGYGATDSKAKASQRGRHNLNMSSGSSNTSALMLQLGFGMLPWAKHCEYTSGRQVGQRLGIVTMTTNRLNARVYLALSVQRKLFFLKFGPFFRTSDVSYSGALRTNIS